MSPHEALVAATGLHAGFQLVVTALVYPVLAQTSQPGFAEAHARHTRRIAPVVAVVYGLAAGACLWVLLSGPSGWGEWTALVATAVAASVTAASAAPTHSRLGASGPAPALLRRLLVTDRLRLVAAVVALLGALAG